MIESLINYVVHSPSDEGSPLFLELNTADMLVAMGSGADKVRLYDNNASEANMPYVRLLDKGQRQRMATFLGGSYTEKQTLVCECVATGATALSATNRAELLKLAVEGFVKTQQSGSPDQETPTTGKGREYTATRTALIELWVFKERKG
jgi:glutamate-1-semialdehyde aminotransferase